MLGENRTRKIRIATFGTCNSERIAVETQIWGTRFRQHFNRWRHTSPQLLLISSKYIYPRSQLRIYWSYFSLSSQHVSAPSGHPQVKYNYITYISRESYRYCCCWLLPLFFLSRWRLESATKLTCPYIINLGVSWKRSDSTFQFHAFLIFLFAFL
jgi:hypothetical protein